MHFVRTLIISGTCILLAGCGGDNGPLSAETTSSPQQAATSEQPADLVRDRSIPTLYSVVPPFQATRLIARCSEAAKRTCYLRVTGARRALRDDFGVQTLITAAGRAGFAPADVDRAHVVILDTKSKPVVEAEFTRDEWERITARNLNPSFDALRSAAVSWHDRR